MALTPQQLNRATLARQLLLQRAELDAVDGIRRITTVQAQEPASPYIALWNRLAGFDPSQLDEAFASHAVVKASLMRITLHAVAAEDYTAFHETMLGTLRAARLNDRRFTSTGLTSDDADATVPDLVEFAAQPRAKADVERMLTDRLGGEPEPRLWWALRTFAPLIHAPTGGPWSYGLQPSFVAAPTTPERPPAEVAVRRMLWRYLEAFGPASGRDVAQFTMLRQPTVKPALAAMADDLVTLEGPDGVTLYDVPDAAVPDGDIPAPPRLLAMWDSILLAYADRSRIIPERYRGHVIRRNGDVLPTLLVDGYVSGVWRTVDGGIEVTTFQPLTDDVWEAIAEEAEALLGFLVDRDPTPYRRYGRWWEGMPSAETRVLPG